LPNAVADPVATTTARPEPWWTTVAFELGHLDQAHVGRNKVAESQTHNIARHDIGNVETLLLAVAPDHRLVVDVAMQRGDRELGPVLVEEPEADA
jgi:hypothetical protein